MNAQYQKKTTVNDESNSQTDDIDIVSFDRRRRAEEIRLNEDAEREKRRRQQLQRRREERIRRAKIERIKNLCLLGTIAIGALFIVIGGITALVKTVSSASDNNTPTKPDNTVSAEETALITDFNSFEGIIYSKAENTFLSAADKMISDITLSAGNSARIPTSTSKINEYGELSERYSLFSSSDSYNEFRNAVKNTPIFSNGYIWSETESMKSTVTDGYMYDTNTAFITAVSNICLSDGNTDFLGEVDTDTQPRRDSSRGMTVGDKLEKAVAYLFDNNTIDGGLKFDTISSLCYIHTADNNGTSSGKPSNKWFNFRFGYLDAYSNISFNRAMKKLIQLYTLAGAPEIADQYNAIATQHAAAFNEKFWDSVKQRYVGCFDKNGNSYDYGFVFINLEAIEAGIADTEKATAIFSWLDGERLIESDTSKGSDIYAYGFAPRNTTVPAEDKWWDYLGGTLPLSANGGYNKYYQNGGISLSTSYYDIMARAAVNDNAAVSAKIAALAGEYTNSGFAFADNRIYGISETISSGLAPVSILKTVFNLSSTGHRLNITPKPELIPASVDEKNKTQPLTAYGVSGIGYAKNTYGFLFDSDKVYITAVSKKPVRINIGGFEADTGYDIVVVDSGLEISRIPQKADAEGIVSVAAEFGSTSYLRIEKTQISKNK